MGSTDIRLIIIDNPFEKEKRRELNTEFCPLLTIGGYLQRAGIAPENYVVIHNGGRADTTALPHPGDEIIAVVDIQKVGKGSLFSFIVGGLLVGAGAVMNAGAPGSGMFLMTMGGSMMVGTVVGVVASSLFTPNIPGTTSNFEDSATYRWGGITNMVAEGAPVPIVYGQHRVGGAIIESFIDGGPDAGYQDALYHNVLIALSEGEIHSIDTATIEVNGTPITEYDDNETAETAPKNILLSSVMQPVFDSAADLVTYEIDRFTLSIYVPDRLQRIAWYINDEGKPRLTRAYDTLELTLLLNGAETRTVRLSNGNFDKKGYCKHSIDLPHSGTWSLAISAVRRTESGAAYDFNGEKITAVSYTRKGGIYYIATRTGTDDQEPIPGFGNVRKHSQISGKKITNGNSQSFTTQDTCDAAVVSVSFPALYNLDDKGNMKSLTVNFEVQYRLFSDPDEPENWHYAYDPSDGDTTFNCRKASRSESVFNWRINFPQSGKYIIRVVRISADYSDTDTRNFADSYLAAVLEIKNANIAYNNTALLAVRFRATDQLSNTTPEYTVQTCGRRIRDVRNIYAEPTPNSNPANIYLDLATHGRYALGRSVDEADLPAFQAFADHCDEVVTFTDEEGNTVEQKRYEMHIVYDQLWTGADALEKLLGTCFAALTYRGDQLSVAVRKKGTPKQMFTMGNIIENSFSEKLTNFSTVPNQLNAQFLDEDNNYEQTTISIFDKDRVNEPVISQTIQLFGVTNKHTVRRILAQNLRMLKSMGSTISFRAGYDAVVAELYDVILFQHDVPQYGYGGSVSAVDGNEIRLDVEISIGISTQYRLRVQKKNGDFLLNDIYRSSAQGSVTTAVITLPEGHGVTEGDIWAFGELGKEAKPYQIVSLELDIGESSEVAIIAEEYNESVFSDDISSYIDVTEYSSLRRTPRYIIGEDGEITRIDDIVPVADPRSVVPPFVTGIRLQEEVSVYSTKQSFSNIGVYFTPAPLSGYDAVVVAEYEVLYSTDKRSWISSGRTKTGYFPILNLPVGGTYSVIVRSHTNYGVSNSPENVTALRNLASITLIGEQQIYSTVGNLRIERLKEGILLKWDSAEDTAFFRILRNDAVIADRLTIAEYIDTAELTAGQYTYKVLPVDEWGNAGTAAMAGVTIGVPAAPYNPLTVADTFAVHIEWGHSGDDISQYEIWRSDENNVATAVLIGTSETKNYTDSDLPLIGNYFYWVRAVDRWGYKSSFSTAVAGQTDATAAKLWEALFGDDDPEDMREKFNNLPDTFKEIEEAIAGIFPYDDDVYDSGVYEKTLADIRPVGPLLNQFMAQTETEFVEFAIQLDNISFTVAALEDGFIQQYTQITQAVDSITLDVQNLSDTLSQQATQITQNADSIALRVAQQDYDYDMTLISGALASLELDIDEISGTVYDSGTGLLARMTIQESQFNVAITNLATGKAMTGFYVQADPGQNISEIGLMADKVAIYSPHAGNQKMALFNTAEGVFGLNMNMVVNGSIAAEKLSVTDLSTIKANMGTITAGKMQSTDGKMLIDLNSKIIRITV